MIIIGCEPAPVRDFIEQLEGLLPRLSMGGVTQAPDPEENPSEFASHYVGIYESLYKCVMYNSKIGPSTIAQYCQFSTLYHFCTDEVRQTIMDFIHYYMQFSDVSYEAKRGII